MPNRVLAVLVDPETGVIVALNLFPCVEVGLALESDGIGLTAVECLSCIQGVFETEIGDDVGHVLWPVSQMARNIFCAKIPFISSQRRGSSPSNRDR